MNRCTLSQSGAGPLVAMLIALVGVGSPLRAQSDSAAPAGSSVIAVVNADPITNDQLSA